MPSDVTKTLSDSVREIFPDEAEIVGDHDLERMAGDSRIGEKDAGDQLVKMVKGGQSNEVAAIIEIVAAAVALGREIIECYFLLKREFGRKPTSEEVLRRLIGKREHHPKVSAKRKQLATSVINRLDP